MNKSNEVPRCDCTVIHEDVIDRVKGEMPAAEQMYDLSELFKSLGDQTRLKILFALSKNKMCVCDIAVLLGMTKSSISHQLRILKQSKLVNYRRDGKVVYYSLADNHVKNIFDQGLLHVCE